MFIHLFIHFVCLFLAEDHLRGTGAALNRSALIWVAQLV